MNSEQTVRRRFGKVSLGSRLSAVSQLAILVAIAFALLWPAPFTQNQLFGSWAGSDLVYSQWPFALMIQRTFAQAHQLPFWNPYFGGGQPLGADPLAALFYPPTQLVHFFFLRTYFLVLFLRNLVFPGLCALLLLSRPPNLPTLPAPR